MCKRIIALLAAFVICFCVMPVCYADSDGEYISKTSSYWDRVLHGLVNGTSGVFLLSSGIKGVASFLNSDICALSSDGYHYADSLTSNTYHQGKNGASYGEAICKFCGKPFLCYASDLSTAYDDYVETLPATGYNSAGHLVVQLPHLSGSSLESYYRGNSSGNSRKIPFDEETVYGRNVISVENSGTEIVWAQKLYGSGGTSGFSMCIYTRFEFPISGYYRRLGSKYCNYVLYDINSVSYEFPTYYPEDSNFAYKREGSEFFESRKDYMYFESVSSFTYYSSCYRLFGPVYEVIPDTAVSGDTVTNNYTIYYLVEGSGEAPADCPHNWTEISSTPATCTVPGSRLLTCSLCSQTKTEPIPTLGHNWQVKQTVTTQYDDTGQLTQEGYTIYECSRCKEQYKAASGSGPPVSPSDPDVSDGGVFSGIFGLLVDFLSFFWKTFKDFTSSGVKAFLDSLKDGTSDIFGLLNPFDWSA